MNDKNDTTGLDDTMDTTKNLIDALAAACSEGEMALIAYRLRTAERGTDVAAAARVHDLAGRIIRRIGGLESYTRHFVRMGLGRA